MAAWYYLRRMLADARDTYAEAHAAPSAPPAANCNTKPCVAMRAAIKLLEDALTEEPHHA